MQHSCPRIEALGERKGNRLHPPKPTAPRCYPEGRSWSSRKPSSVSTWLPSPRERSEQGQGEMIICLGWPSPTTSSSLPAASLAFATLRLGLVGVGHTSPLIWPCSDWGLPCHRCYQRRGGLLPHRFTLTSRDFAAPDGGLFSVALSVAFRRPGVTWQSTRWSSDFPRAPCGARDHRTQPVVKI